MRHNVFLVLNPATGFNPRTRRACDGTFQRSPREIGSFNPRTRRACDGGESCRGSSGNVSIHARVERATDRSAMHNIRKICFNPRTRRACDSTIFWIAKYDFPVSIHARVERATRRRVGDHQRPFSFNPRTRRACDKNPHNARIPSLRFQSTHA